MTARAFTVIPNTWRIKARDLLSIDPSVLLRTFRGALYRYGARDADGWLIAFIHGEFDTGTRYYQLHLHGIASGGMIDVLGRLNRESIYKSFRPTGQTRGPVFQQIQIKREPLTNLPHSISYCLKGYWPGRWSDASGEGKPANLIRGNKRKARIPEPHHTQVLLWLDRWRLQDITLMVHLSVTTQGLTPSK